MTGIKDLTESAKVEEVEKDQKQMNAVVKKTFSDLTTIYMQDFFKFSKDMAESFRIMLDNLKVRIEQFHEENRSIFDSFTLSHLRKWTQRDQ